MGIGSLELVVIFCMSFIAIVAYLVDYASLQVALRAPVCLLFAALLSPPDIFSMVLLATIFYIAYEAGMRHKRRQSVSNQR